VDYIVKPIEPFLIQCKVDVFLRLHRQQIELKEKKKYIWNCSIWTMILLSFMTFRGKYVM